MAPDPRRLAISLLALAIACGVPDPDNVEVAVQLDDVQISLSPTTFGRQIQGTLTLTAVLGELAQQDTTVRWEKLALVRPETNEELLVLPIASRVPSSVAVPKGTTQTLGFEIETSVVKAEALPALCSGQVRVIASVFDQAKARPKSAYSAAFSLPGCPGG